MPAQLKYVDPNHPRSSFSRAYAAFSATRLGRLFSAKVAWKLDPYLLRATRGRFGMGLVLPTALLETRGAKSGALRRNAVIYFHDENQVTNSEDQATTDEDQATTDENQATTDENQTADDADRVTIIASKAGAAQHPAWFHNLRAHPDVTFGGIPMRATVVSDEAECDRIWALADRVFAPYATYRREAAKVNRTIPIVQLTPCDAPLTDEDVRRTLEAVREHR
jgi:deazaflavin-dependent oxidoreductase (nitroreductase family)